MSEVAANNSENQENSVQAQNEAGEPALVADNKSIVEEAASASGAPTTDDKVVAAPTADDAAEVEAEAEPEYVEESSPKVENNKKTPVKRTPSKRMSFIERAQKESEELVKNLGGSLELEGGRRTRSSTRGTPTRSAVVATPPPAKKARSSAATSSTATTTPSRRGRGRKIDTSEPTEVEVATEENKESEDADETKSEKAADNNDSEKSSVENAENSVVDAANSAAEAEEKETAETAKKNDGEEKTPVEIAANVAKKALDNIDAPLETIPEAEQNNIDHKLEVETKQNADSEEQNKSDSPMDTDEDAKPASEVAVTEAVKKTVEDSKNIIKSTSPTAESSVKIAGTAIEKQSTPEPMEVDSSSSKDNGDKIESTPTIAAVENMEEDPVEEDNSTEAVAAVSENSIATNITEKQPSVDPASKEVIKQVESSVVDEVKIVSATTAEAAVVKPVVVESNSVESVVANNTKSVDIAAAGEPQATANAKPATTTENNKSENEFCEPKIVSPPTSSDGVVPATPQFCN